MAAQVINLLPSQTVSASGAGGAIPITTATMLWAFVNKTAAVATVTDLDVWIEASVDGGINWHPLVADVVNDRGTVASNRINILDSDTSTSATKASATYKQVPAPLIRAAWTFTGSGGSQSATFSVTAEAK
jgi:hypothetical protein